MIEVNDVLKIPKNVRLRFYRENLASKHPTISPVFSGAKSAILKISSGFCMVCLFTHLSQFIQGSESLAEMASEHEKVESLV